MPARKPWPARLAGRVVSRRPLFVFLRKVLAPESARGPDVVVASVSQAHPVGVVVRPRRHPRAVGAPISGKALLTAARKAMEALGN